MAFGVAFYSIIVGSLTSIITETLFSNDNLASKLKALEDFSMEVRLDL